MRRKLPGIGGISPMKAVLSCAVAAFCGSVTGLVLAQGDVEAGRIKAETCMGCHGIPGYTMVYPTYRVPKLGGQHAAYIVSALQEYKTGQRRNAIMRAQAVALSNKDMEDIAAYFESLGGAAPAGGGGGQQQAAKADGGGGQQQAAKSGGAGAGGVQASGKQTFAQACAACHQTGTMGAPKLGSKADWAPLIKKGKQTLYTHAINGIGAMPPKGGNPSLSNEQVKAAVDYMLNAAQ
jgi:cytochrome c5